MVKHFVVPNTPINFLASYRNFYSAKSLLELLIFLTVLSVILYLSSNLKLNSDVSNRQNNILQLQQLQQALQLARINAMSLNTEVYLCPTSNYIICDYDWANNLMIFVAGQPNTISNKHNINNTNNKKILHRLSPVFTDHLLRFHFFGNQLAQKITFMSTGFTINNGHFCISGELDCLYINQAGKTYIVSK